LPTYVNTSNVILNKYNVNFPPNQEIQTIFIFDDDSRLYKVNDQPYYNPISSSTNITFTGASTKTITIDHTISTYIQIYNVKSCDLTIYFNSASNTPPLYLSPGNKFSTHAVRIINKILLTSNGAGSCTLMTKLKSAEVS
jgi:hypothetical protein